MSHRGWLLAALVVGASLRAIGLIDQSVWLDEAFSLDLAREPVVQMLRDIATGDAHPPLFYLALHYADAALHWPLEWYRVLLLPFGIATIALTWWLARRLAEGAAHAGTTTIADIAAFTVALAPLAVTWERVLRMYSLEAALAAGSWALLLCAGGAQQRRAWWWAGYAVCAVGLVYAHYLGWLVLGSQCVYAAVALRDRWPVFAAFGIALVSYVPWFPALVSQAGFGGAARSDPFVYIAADALGSGLDPSGIHTVAVGIGAWLVVAVLIIGASLIARGSFLPYALAAPVVQLALGAILHKNLLPTRYFTYDVWAFALAFAVVVVYLWSRHWRALGVAAVAAAALISIVGDVHLLFDPRYQFTDWRAVARIVADNARPTDVVVFDQGMPIHVVRAMPGFAGRTLIGLDGPLGLRNVIAAVRKRSEARIWYVENQPEYPDPQRRVSADLQARRRLLRYWMQRHSDLGTTVLVALFDVERRL